MSYQFFSTANLDGTFFDFKRAWLTLASMYIPLVFCFSKIRFGIFCANFFYPITVSRKKKKKNIYRIPRKRSIDRLCRRGRNVFIGPKWFVDHEKKKKKKTEHLQHKKSILFTEIPYFLTPARSRANNECFDKFMS